MAVALIVRTATIAQGDIEIAIRPKAHGATVVIGLGLVDAQDFPAAGGVHLVGIGRVHTPFGDDGLVIVVGGGRGEIRRAPELDSEV